MDPSRCPTITGQWRPFQVVPFLTNFSAPELSCFMRANLDEPFAQKFSQFVLKLNITGRDFIGIEDDHLQRLCGANEPKAFRDLKHWKVALTRPKTPHVRNVFAIPPSPIAIPAPFSEQQDIDNNEDFQFTFSSPDSTTTDLSYSSEEAPISPYATSSSFPDVHVESDDESDSVHDILDQNIQGPHEQKESTRFDENYSDDACPQLPQLTPESPQRHGDLVDRTIPLADESNTAPISLGGIGSSSAAIRSNGEEESVYRTPTPAAVELPASAEPCSHIHTPGSVDPGLQVVEDMFGRDAPLAIAAISGEPIAQESTEPPTEGQVVHEDTANPTYACISDANEASDLPATRTQPVGPATSSDATLDASAFEDSLQDTWDLDDICIAWEQEVEETEATGVTPNTQIIALSEAPEASANRPPIDLADTTADSSAPFHDIVRDPIGNLPSASYNPAEQSSIDISSAFFTDPGNELETVEVSGIATGDVVPFIPSDHPPPHSVNLGNDPHGSTSAKATHNTQSLENSVLIAISATDFDGKTADSLIEHKATFFPHPTSPTSPPTIPVNKEDDSETTEAEAPSIGTSPYVDSNLEIGRLTSPLPSELATPFSQKSMELQAHSDAIAKSEGFGNLADGDHCVETVGKSSVAPQSPIYQMVGAFGSEDLQFCSNLDDEEHDFGEDRVNAEGADDLGLLRPSSPQSDYGMSGLSAVMQLKTFEEDMAIMSPSASPLLYSRRLTDALISTEALTDGLLGLTVSPELTLIQTPVTATVDYALIFSPSTSYRGASYSEIGHVEGIFGPYVEAGSELTTGSKRPVLEIEIPEVSMFDDDLISSLMSSSSLYQYRTHVFDPTTQVPSNTPSLYRSVLPLSGGSERVRYLASPHMSMQEKRLSHSNNIEQGFTLLNSPIDITNRRGHDRKLEVITENLAQDCTEMHNNGPADASQPTTAASPLIDKLKSVVRAFWTPIGSSAQCPPELNSSVSLPGGYDAAPSAPQSPELLQYFQSSRELP
ncbi:hypothetical protein FA15DRAFT_757780 [Coprinopsis marcescibilis]|uniref:Uncharacterized protein n=1 Tax=Coprinopsis marcescibilis TaxID=230819 RepID=A0A5C3KQX2_COPMA|nr:hypothetical protein FA15DRAFT_757780 [Coprinopsis marcescibilis]